MKPLVYYKGPVAVCMVVGCNKKAIYKKSQDHRTFETQRGYCSEHKALAATAPRVTRKKEHQLVQYLAHRDSNQ
jgi:hypothetical protein